MFCPGNVAVLKVRRVVVAGAALATIKLEIAEMNRRIGVVSQLVTAAVARKQAEKRERKEKHAKLNMSAEEASQASDETASHKS